MTAEPRNAGPILDELGVTLDLEDDDRITEVMVLAKTTNLDTGEVGLIIGANGGLDWIAQAGLLAAAGLILNQDDDR